MKQSQAEKLYELLKDGKPHRTDEIQRVVYGGDHLGLSRVGARVFDIKKKYGVEIKGWKDKERPSLYYYQLVRSQPSGRLFVPAEPTPIRSATEVFFRT